MNNHRQYIDEIKLIFIHIPKTGGSFIEGNLFKLAQHFNQMYDYFGGHCICGEYKNNERFDDYTYFSVVRNPYDRIYSAYRYLKNGGSGAIGDKKVWTHKLNSPSSIEEMIDTIYQIGLDNLVHLREQYKFCTYKNEIIGNILKYEKLDSDFLNFIDIYKSNKFVYDFMYNEIYKNIKIANSYDLNLDDESIKKINYLYKIDFEYFEYNKIEI